MISRRAFRSQVRQLLGALGTRGEDVAATLASAGVHGLRDNGEQCALAAYLHVVLGSDPRVQAVKVGTRATAITGSRWWPRTVTVAHPRAVEDFVRAFDQGTFPHLLRPAQTETTPQ